MIEYRIEHEFETTPEAYWEMFFSPAYNEQLWPALDIQREVCELREEGDGQTREILRVQRLVPNRKVPQIIKRLVKGAIAYEERNHWRAATSSMTVEIVPNFLADKIKSGGLYKLEAAGPGRIRRIWQGHCHCTVPIVGRRIGEHIVEEVRNSYERTTTFTRDWLAKHAA